MLTGWVLLAALAAHAPLSNSPERSNEPQTTTPVPQSTTVADVPSPLTHLVQNFGHDASHLVSRESAFILLGGYAATAIAHRSDGNVEAWVQRQSASSSAASFGDFVGNGWTQATAAVATWSAGALSHNHTVERVGADLIRAEVLNSVMTESLKFAVNRTRPDGSPYSFPSGHTSATFATAAILQNDVGWGAGAAVYAAGGFVSWARIRGDHHWLSDVVAGGVIGVLSGRAVTRGHDGSKWTLTPVTTPGGGAIYVVIGDRSSRMDRW